MIKTRVKTPSTVVSRNSKGIAGIVTACSRRCVVVGLTSVLCASFVVGQSAGAPGSSQSAPAISISSGSKVIGPGDLPGNFRDLLKQMGNRMTSDTAAQVTLAGTITDANGSRPAQILVQSPGYLSYQESAQHITFNGTAAQTKAGQLTSGDQGIFESLLADFPDMIFLQVATGGSLRRIGSHFRTDDGVARSYSGPYWTLFAFSPKNRPGLARATPLQEEIFIAVDEQTELMAEVRTVVVSQAGQRNVTQTQFSNWIQQNSQWFPGKIVRLENGKQVLSFQTLNAGVGPASDPAVFAP